MAVPGELLRSDARPVPKSGSPSWFCRRRYASPHHSTKDRSSSAFQNGGFWKFSLPMNARNSIQGLKRDEFLVWVKRGMWGARFRDFTIHQNWFLGPISCKEMALYHDEWLADQYYQSETKTSQELRMLSRSLSDCKSLLLNLNLNLNRCHCLCSDCSDCSVTVVSL